jgi:hypothetical protein
MTTTNVTQAAMRTPHPGTAPLFAWEERAGESCVFIRRKSGEYLAGWS